MYQSKIKAIEKVASIIKAHYEPGGHAKCYKQVWRRFIYPEMGISYVTFRRYQKNMDILKTD